MDFQKSKMQIKVKNSVYILTGLLLLILSIDSVGQEEKLQVQGAIQIGNTSGTNPGTIRWTGIDFQGFDGNNWVSLTSGNSTSATGTIITDIDGNKYHTVKIGTQIWMRENLRTSRYNDGTPIEERTIKTEWASASTDSVGAFCWYQNNHIIDFIYGKLYNWYAVDEGKLCPNGWHVPSEPELDILINVLGGTSIAGGKMKETGLLHWTSPNDGATNESGFTGLPGGIRGDLGGFTQLSDRGYWWTSNETSGNKGRFFLMIHDGDQVSKFQDVKGIGFSVRCLKN